MTDGAKAQVWAATWQAWGGSYAITGPQANDARFPGQWFQLESGLHYNWHRHYDPSIGRYTQPDPLGFVDGPDLFGYVGGHPVSYVDPDGRYRISGPVSQSLSQTRPPPPSRPSTNMSPIPDYPKSGEWEMPPIRDPADTGNRQCSCRCRATDRAKQSSYFAERTNGQCYQATRDACKAARQSCQIGNGDVHHQQAKCSDGTIRDGGGREIGRYRHDG
ncbi:MAG: RHS repeat-associated core domain-containing protein [Hyphomicrobiaceae bacterium]|nr:RHS repeat-associated core domain-containing protein [Hyphomicrobiaceae bacterium]